LGEERKTPNRKENYMTFTFKTAATAIALSLVLGSGSAFAKAHDQGVADGDFDPGTQDGAAIGEGGVSAGQIGTRGDTASRLGSDNTVEPVVGRGVNEPD